MKMKRLQSSHLSLTLAFLSVPPHKDSDLVLEEMKKMKLLAGKLCLYIYIYFLY